jgi:hypothetical protein
LINDTSQYKIKKEGLEKDVHLPHGEHIGLLEKRIEEKYEPGNI